MRINVDIKKTQCLMKKMKTMIKIVSFFKKDIPNPIDFDKDHIPELVQALSVRPDIMREAY